MHWRNRLFLTFESLTLHLFFLDSVKQCGTTIHLLVTRLHETYFEWFHELNNFKVVVRFNTLTLHVHDRLFYYQELIYTISSTNRDLIFLYLICYYCCKH